MEQRKGEESARLRDVPVSDAANFNNMRSSQRPLLDLAHISKDLMTPLLIMTYLAWLSRCKCSVCKRNHEF